MCFPGMGGRTCRTWIVLERRFWHGLRSPLHIDMRPMASAYQRTGMGNSRPGWPRQVQCHLNEALDLSDAAQMRGLPAHQEPKALIQSPRRRGPAAFQAR